MAKGAEHFPAPVSRLLVTGGGRHNATLMKHLTRKFACPVAPVEAAGLNGDMLEAQAFAFLAVRVMRGMPTSCPGTTGFPPPWAEGRSADLSPSQHRGRIDHQGRPDQGEGQQFDL